jgi:hypothetical protein
MATPEEDGDGGTGVCETASTTASTRRDGDCAVCLCLCAREVRELPGPARVCCSMASAVGFC